MPDDPKPSAGRDGSAGAPLRLLHLEDDPLDAELAAATMTDDGLHCDIQRVDSRSAFEAALLAERFDVIVSDYNLPAFDGLTAQSLATRLAPETPFIFLSGALGEDMAADRLKDGAADFVLKQRIAKLPAAVRRARREVELREQGRRAQDEVRRLNADLEARVAQRTAALAESQRYLNAIMDSAPAVIVAADTQGRILLANRALQRQTGRSVDELRGKTVHDLMPPGAAHVLWDHEQQVMRERRPLYFEETVIEPGGLHVYGTTRFPLYDENDAVVGGCAIAIDITAQKDTDDQIKRARLEAVRASQAKSTFLSQISHELRTPLNAVLGFAQLFDASALSAEQAENVQQILAGGRHLLTLINEVLDITRIESGTLSMSPESVGVLEVVTDAVDLIRPLANERGVTIEVPALADAYAAVHADRQRLFQVLINLLSNGVKYNRPDGRVIVGCEAGPPGRFRIAVTDTGPGISISRLKLLFQPFERLGAEHTATEGTGLGLALARALVEAMGGSLVVNSVVDRGSTFVVELPAAERAERTEADTATATDTSAAAPTPSGRGTVLYIEDNLSNVRLMERVLARRPGVTLYHAPGGSVGLEMVRERHPDLVLLDLHLQGMSGEEVLQRLSADPASRGIPVVVLTADASPALPRRLKSNGAAGLLTKPIDVTTVLRLLDECLNRQTGLDAHD